MNLRVCLTPSAFKPESYGPETIVVVADIFRATSTICTALYHGAASVRPVSSLEEARRLKAGGAIVAAEEDGLKPDFADFGNDPLEFTRSRVSGIDLVMATTNGTRAVKMAEGGTVVTGSFLNLSILASWLIQQHTDILVLCAGWKDNESLEDMLYAGALASLLRNSADIRLKGDPAEMAAALWQYAKDRPAEFARRGEHFQRLERLGLAGSVEFILTPDQCPVIPVYRLGVIRDIAASGK